MSIDALTYSAFVAEMQKSASDKAEDKKPSTALELAKLVGAGTLGFGAGTAGGLLTGHLLNKAVERATGKPIPSNWAYKAAPLLGTAAGIAYAVHKAKEQEAVRRALQDSTDSGSR
jgi:hypothetical protein